MIFGMTIPVFIHVVLSFVGIISGVAVLAQLLQSRVHANLTALFLASTVATSATGFLLPAARFLPSHAVGLLSLAVLAIAVFARYLRHSAGSWRWIYVVSAVISLYLNVFVLVAQAFLKIPALRALAPTQTEPPFQIAQAIVLALFILLGIGAVARFRPAPLPAS